MESNGCTMVTEFRCFMGGGGPNGAPKRYCRAGRRDCEFRHSHRFSCTSHSDVSRGFHFEKFLPSLPFHPRQIRVNEPDIFFSTLHFWKIHTLNRWLCSCTVCHTSGLDSYLLLLRICLHALRSSVCCKGIVATRRTRSYPVNSWVGRPAPERPLPVCPRLSGAFPTRSAVRFF